MKIVASNSITVSNVNDGTITHTAWAYSSDGTDRFTTVYPNLNLLDGTKDFSWNWTNSSSWVTDGTYKGLTVKKRTAQWSGIYKTFTAPKDGVYTFSAYVKSSGNTANIYRYGEINSIGGSQGPIQKSMGNNFDWTRDTVTLNLKANDNVWIRYEISGAGTDSILWNAGHKCEYGSTATPYMGASTEVTTADWPSYIGQYSDFSSTVSTDHAKYAPWTIFKGNDGVGVTSTIITYAMSTSGTTAPSTGWISSVPTLVKGQYLWTKTVWTYTDNSSKTGYSVTYISKDGSNGTDGTSGIIVSSVAPTSPQIGQLWQDTSTTPQIVKKWTGASWVIWKMYVENMVVDTISSMSSDLGDVTAGTVTLMDDNFILNGQPKKYGIHQSKFGLISSGPTFEPTGIVNNTQMGVANLNKGELRFIVTDYTENLKVLQDAGMSDPNTAFIRFNSYDNGKDVMTISSSGDIVFKGITSQDTPWITLSSGVKYKYMFSRVYISFAITGTSAQYMQFGFLPESKRPLTDIFLALTAWSTGVQNDRHVQIRASDGAIILWNPVSNQVYNGEVSFTL